MERTFGILGHGLLLWGFVITLLDTPHLVRLYWMSVQPDTETSAVQYTTLKTDIHAPSWIQTHNPSNQVATDLCLRLCGQSDWHMMVLFSKTF